MSQITNSQLIDTSDVLSGLFDIDEDQIKKGSALCRGAPPPESEQGEPRNFGRLDSSATSDRLANVQVFPTARGLGFFPLHKMPTKSRRYLVPW